MRFRFPKRSQLSREVRSIELDGEEITYTVQRSSRRRRTIQLQVDANSGLKVLVPHTLGDYEIEHFLRNRSDWIQKHYARSTQGADKFDWRDGGVARFLGRDLTIVVGEGRSEKSGRDLSRTVSKSLEGDVVTVTVPPGMDEERKSDVTRDCLLDWYHQEAWDHLKSRVDEFGKIMGVQPRQLKLSTARKRWGSCSGKQSINLNWRLIMLDEELIDYVVVHELAHLIELNHSSAFWDVVASVLPAHRELRRRIEAQQEILKLD